MYNMFPTWVVQSRRLLFSPLIFGLSYWYDLTLFECSSFNSVVKLNFVVEFQRTDSSRHGEGSEFYFSQSDCVFCFIIIIAIIVIKTVKLGRI